MRSNDRRAFRCLARCNGSACRILAWLSIGSGGHFSARDASGTNADSNLPQTACSAVANFRLQRPSQRVSALGAGVSMARTERQGVWRKFDPLVAIRRHKSHRRQGVTRRTAGHGNGLSPAAWDFNRGSQRKRVSHRQQAACRTRDFARHGQRGRAGGPGPCAEQPAIGLVRPVPDNLPLLPRLPRSNKWRGSTCRRATGRAHGRIGGER